MSDGLFNPEAFEQMPGQMSMEQDEAVRDRCWCDGLPGRCTACIAADAQDADELEKGR